MARRDSDAGGKKGRGRRGLTRSLALQIRIPLKRKKENPRGPTKTEREKG